MDQGPGTGRRVTGSRPRFERPAAGPAALGAAGRQVVVAGGDDGGRHAERPEQPGVQQLGVRDAGLRGEGVTEH
ncbi:hypothetical protein [Micromonospora sp. NPDC005324]|uniref:hypothetical protein n=1 Tax=Micromonospora sp. NPDC005324 TaxID=3157033 RepID=UPI0033B5954B